MAANAKKLGLPGLRGMIKKKGGLEAESQVSLFQVHA